MWLNVFYVDPLIVMFVKPTLQNLANHWPNNNYNYIVMLYPRNVLATEDLLTLIRVLSSFTLSLSLLIRFRDPFKYNLLIYYT